MSAVRVVVADLAIRTDAEGRYCLNDLHRAAGGEDRDKPGNWLRQDSAQALADEIDRCSNLSNGGGAINVVQGGQGQGTFVARELVYAYAMWISPAFHLKVIRAFDALRTAVLPNASSVEEIVAEAVRLNREVKADVKAIAAQLPQLVTKADLDAKVIELRPRKNLTRATKTDHDGLYPRYGCGFCHKQVPKEQRHYEHFFACQRADFEHTWVVCATPCHADMTSGEITRTDAERAFHAYQDWARRERQREAQPSPPSAWLALPALPMPCMQMELL